MSKKNPTAVVTDSVEIHVPFHDVDPAGVVWHGHYFKYFEIARCKMLEKINYNYNHMRDSGYFWPVVDSNVRYRKPAFYDQTISVEARLIEWELRLMIDYIIRDADDDVLVRGRTIQVAVRHEGWEMMLGSPEVLLDCVNRYLESQSS